MKEDTNRIDPPEPKPDYVGCSLCQGEGGDIESGRPCPKCHGFGVINSNEIEE